MKRKTYISQYTITELSLLTLAVIIVASLIYIRIFKKNLYLEIKESIFFAFGLMLSIIFDKMFAYKVFYDRRERATIITSNIVDTKSVHKFGLQRDKRIAKQRKGNIKKNRRTIKK